MYKKKLVNTNMRNTFMTWGWPLSAREGCGLCMFLPVRSCMCPHTHTILEKCLYNIKNILHPHYSVLFLCCSLNYSLWTKSLSHASRTRHHIFFLFNLNHFFPDSLSSSLEMFWDFLLLGFFVWWLFCFVLFFFPLPQQAPNTWNLKVKTLLNGFSGDVFWLCHTLLCGLPS